MSTVTRRSAASFRTRSRLRRAICPMSHGQRCDTSCRANCNTLLTIRPQRSASDWMPGSTESRICSPSGRRRACTATSALSTMPCSGLLISWAMPAASVPIEASRSGQPQGLLGLLLLGDVPAGPEDPHHPLLLVVPDRQAVVADPADSAVLGDHAELGDVLLPGQQPLPPLLEERPVFLIDHADPVHRVELGRRVAGDAAHLAHRPVPHERSVRRDPACCRPDARSTGRSRGSGSPIRGAAARPASAGRSPAGAVGWPGPSRPSAGRPRCGPPGSHYSVGGRRPAVPLRASEGPSLALARRACAAGTAATIGLAG